MYKLGGNVITFQKDTSSLKKGESFGDTIHTLSTYGDVMILRHPNKDMIEEAEKYSSIPIINAGNGNGEHPTQALLDLFTIHKHLKRIEMIIDRFKMSLQCVKNNRNFLRQQIRLF